MTEAIDIDDLEKKYAKGIMRKQVIAVSGVSLQVKQGEAFGFIGPNGAGKSSTIRILAGLARPTHGSVRLFGIDSQLPEARRGVGYVPENPCLYDYLTPLEILCMGMRLHHVRKKDTHKHCLDWLERLELAHVANSPIRSFSKGMTQR
ncbi:MAG TPA: ABC transporter ATP-binding protein, partial [Rhodocyclaceae bacterium]|nr:ABC transporter ATP-binding protein [Rhodocyclaceae bacterium]